ncbi:MAG: DUF2214 family protein [Betaproteobacteria bacterium]|nr:DUF2214 family protein [Betaproteobacteria bacterium]
MIKDALLAYFHFAAIFLLFAFLTVEAMMLRNPLDTAGVRLVARVDAWYGASAVMVLISGLLRWFMGAKGSAFYNPNPVFHAKVTLFVLVGLLSIKPTLQFLRWSRELKQNASFLPPLDEQKKLRRLVMIQLHLAAIIPLLAVLMARGIGHS